MISVDNSDYDLTVGSPIAINMMPHFPDKKIELENSVAKQQC